MSITKMLYVSDFTRKIGHGLLTGFAFALARPRDGPDVQRPGRLSALAQTGNNSLFRSGTFATFAVSSVLAQLAMPNCRETGGFGRSHSLSFDHRLRPDTLRTAMATAFFCPTSTTSFLPRVTPV